MDTSRKRILVVDDEELVRYALVSAFAASGHHVCEAGTAEEALRELQAGEYDLCFLDWKLPGLDGLSTLQCIKALWPRLEVVFMTADWPEGEDQAIIDRLADHFVEKPFDLVTVRDLVAGKNWSPN